MKLARDGNAITQQSVPVGKEGPDYSQDCVLPTYQPVPYVDINVIRGQTSLTQILANYRFIPILTHT
jgi:hypothetical protein